MMMKKRNRKEAQKSQRHNAELTEGGILNTMRENAEFSNTK
jgi:hypothetical protein